MARMKSCFAAVRGVVYTGSEGGEEARVNCSTLREIRNRNGDIRCRDMVDVEGDRGEL